MHSLASSLRRASQPSSLLRSNVCLNNLFSNTYSGCLETRNLGSADVARYGVSGPYALNFRKFIHPDGQKNSEAGRYSAFPNIVNSLENSSQTFRQDGSRWRNTRTFDFVRDQLRNNPYQMSTVHNCDVVSIFIGRNNTKIHLTDSKGQGKAYVSAGCLPEMKSGAKLSRYAAEATAEYMGRKAREMGVKSVVMKVNGFTYFRKKRQAILSFREGFTGSRGGHHPIVHIEDTTRLAHNGCRLKKRRRI